MRPRFIVVHLVAIGLVVRAFGQADQTPAAPPVLPGKGLAEHDFFYAGEAKERRAFIVRKGAVVWAYDDAAGRGEISDAVLLSNGNVLLAHQFAVKLIAPDKRVLWNYDAPPGCEIHTAQAIGKEHVLFIQNGDPAMVKLLLEKGADINRKSLTTGNRTPLDLADRHGDDEISAYLRSKGAVASKPTAH